LFFAHQQLFDDDISRRALGSEKEMVS
jgi:hypothetical protein